MKATYRNHRMEYGSGISRSDYREYKNAAAKVNRTNIVIIEYTAIVLVFIVALIFSIMFISSKAYADNSNNNRVKKYKSVMIYGGDSFESIAYSNMTEEYASESNYIKEVCSINNITNDTKLIPGNHIIVPYYDDANCISFNFAE